MRRIIYDFLIVLVLVTAAGYVYVNYGEEIVEYLAGEQMSGMYVESTPIRVSIADEPAEHRLGLSGTESLGEFEGKLFVFSKEDFYSIWMKDMNYPLDIIWINNNRKIVHIEKNVSPDSYPDSYVSEVPARFVLEVNAFFTENANVAVGDEVSLPPGVVPEDLRLMVQ